MPARRSARKSNSRARLSDAITAVYFPLGVPIHPSHHRRRHSAADNATNFIFRSHQKLVTKPTLPQPKSSRQLFSRHI
jgi:hypothetical protein